MTLTSAGLVFRPGRVGRPPPFFATCSFQSCRATRSASPACRRRRRAASPVGSSLRRRRCAARYKNGWAMCASCGCAHRCTDEMPYFNPPPSGEEAGMGVSCVTPAWVSFSVPDVLAIENAVTRRESSDERGTEKRGRGGSSEERRGGEEEAPDAAARPSRGVVRPLLPHTHCISLIVYMVCVGLRCVGGCMHDSLAFYWHFIGLISAGTYYGTCLLK